MTEMEIVAAFVATAAAAQNEPIEGFKVHVGNFENDRPAMVGFVELVSAGWVTKERCMYNGQFAVSKHFADRIQARLNELPKEG